MSSTTLGTTRKRPTQVDLARAAGVSQATVSQVLNETDAAPARITQQTRERVLAAAAQLGYSVNPIAQSLKSGRNHLLGFHTFEAVFPADQSDFYFPFLSGVEREAARQGYDLLLLTPSTERAGGAAARLRRLAMADGCILLGRHVDRDTLRDLVRDDFPFVFIGRREVPGHDISYVGADYAAATAELVARLAAAGHRHIAYIAEGTRGEQSDDRRAGYLSAMRAVEGSTTRISESPLTAADLETWMDGGMTAVVIEPGDDDSTLRAFEQAATELDLEVPADLSAVVLGEPSGFALERDWTRFAIPRTEMAELAVRALIELLADPASAPRQQLVECIIADGATIAPPRHRR